jgi:hypothetical protein
MSSFATVVNIYNRMVAAHNDGIQEAKDAVTGEGADREKALANVDMMDFQGKLALDNLLTQTLSQVSKSENDAAAAIARNI